MSAKLQRLYDRAAMAKEARSFFAKRGVIEVDCPVITRAASIDTQIDLIEVIDGEDNRYLYTSPEYAMKRLLTEGIGDIYQLGHVFRSGESGSKHNPEFMMAEWYRVGFSFDQMIRESVEFCRLFLGALPFSLITYREAFLRYCDIDCRESAVEELLLYAEREGVPLYGNIAEEGVDALLNIILASKIEPQLGNDELTVVIHYPASQAALAKTTLCGNELVAERFEIYHKGMELANGFHELSDAVEQRQRFDQSNAMRIAHGKKGLPIDEQLLKALEKGIPDCCGVAVGFDRLMMLRHSCGDIAEVIPFSWENA